MTNRKRKISGLDALAIYATEGRRPLSLPLSSLIDQATIFEEAAVARGDYLRAERHLRVRRQLKRIAERGRP